jgi:hypothetical protein
MAFRAAVLLAVTLAFLAPSVTAHSAIFSADQQVRASVGLLNEPVSTYAVTGLDVCFTQNTTTSPRPPVAVTNAGDFTALLHAPNGATHAADLEVPFGKPNCLTFSDPLVLTLPGQYTLDLSGSINGTTISGTLVKAGGEVVDRATLTFPDAGVPDDKALDEKVSGLQSRLAALESRTTAIEDGQAQSDSDEGKFAPAPTSTILMLGLAGLVAVLRRGA